ncbi:hypothetical protein LINPERHAP2_LOCUS29527 [Linum perenne]
MEGALPAGSAPSAPLSSAASPVKVVKKAKTTEANGSAGSDVTQKDKRAESPCRDNRVKGPWLVGDHYVLSEEWRPNFEPGFSQVNSIRAWVRLPGLPLENYDVGILTLVGNSIGKTVRVDNTTLFGNRGNYARLCVEIDLNKPLISKYRLRRRVRRVEYEGLHEICFLCGKYGHGKDACPKLRAQDEERPMGESDSTKPESSDPVRPEIDEDYGPWMLAKKNVRRRRTIQNREPPVTQEPVQTNKEPQGSRFSIFSSKGNEGLEGDLAVATAGKPSDLPSVEEAYSSSDDSMSDTDIPQMVEHRVKETPIPNPEDLVTVPPVGSAEGVVPDLGQAVQIKGGASEVSVTPVQPLRSQSEQQGNNERLGVKAKSKSVGTDVKDKKEKLSRQLITGGVKRGPTL